jgi:hypothetical protein
LEIGPKLLHKRRMMAVPSVLLTGTLAAAFCAIHLFIGRLRFLHVEPRSRWLSFAGGVAVAYVFMHMLPELGEHGRNLAEATVLNAALAESAVFAVALGGLALFYGAERALLTSRRLARAGGGRDRPEQGVFWLHIGSSALLIAVIAYLLNNRENATLAGTAIYFVAMSLHFSTANFGSRAHHPELYDRAGRWVLAAATVSGWLFGLVTDLPKAAIAALFAFVSGGIVLTVLKEELPAEREGRFVPFLIGAVLYAALVLAEEGFVVGG